MMTKTMTVAAVIAGLSISAHAGTILSSDFTGIADFGAGNAQNFEYFTGQNYTSDFGVAVATPFRPASLIGQANQPQAGDLFSLAGQKLFGSTNGIYDGAVRIEGVPTSETGWRGISLRFDGMANHFVDNISVDVAIGRDSAGNLWADKTMDWAIELTTDDRTTTILNYAATEFNNFQPGNGLATLTWDLSSFLGGQELELDASKTYELRIAFADWSGTTSQTRVGVLDNLVVTGGLVPTPGSLALLAVGFLGASRRRS